MSIEYFRPDTLEEALALYSGNPEAVLIAGGTDLLVDIHNGKIDPQIMIDLNGIKGLNEITENGGRIRIGALAAFAELQKSSLLRRKAPVLIQAAESIGSPQIRNLATIGGNIMNGSPAADAVTALIALEADIELISSGGKRTVSLDKYLTESSRETGRSDGILTEVSFLTPAPDTGMSFIKIGRRNSLSIARLNGACLIRLEDCTIRQARLAVGAAGPVPQRLTESELFLNGKRITEDVLKEAGELAAEQLRKQIGNRPSGGYKLPVITDLVGLMIKKAIGKEETLQ